MRDLSQPKQLAQHLDENAAAWSEIAGAFDPRALGILGRLEALARMLGELQRGALAPHGLNYAEFTTIRMLRTSPPDFRRSPSELRRLVGQTSAGMTRILAKLEDEGLVRRASHELPELPVSGELRPAYAELEHLTNELPPTERAAPR